MAFMHQLRQLRQERGISQQALADAIFVSRSAVAKWENGLGLPSKVYYTALLAFFNVSEACLAITTEDQARIRKRYRKRGSLLCICGLPLLSCGLLGYYFAFIWKEPPLFGSLPVTIVTTIYITVLQVINHIQRHTFWQNALFFGGLITLGTLILGYGLVFLFRFRGRRHVHE